MSTSNTNGYIPWRDRAAVTKREAASIAARSLPWVDYQIRTGGLFSYQTRRGGPHMVCVQSLVDLLDRLGPVVPQTRIAPWPAVRPRLVWSNPNI